MIQLDKADHAILSALQQDNRQTYAAIAVKVGLSAAAVHARVKKMENAGVIKSYSAKVDARALGLNVIAFILLRLENDTMAANIAPELAKFPEIEECHSVAGEMDSIVKVRTSTPEALEDLLGRIKKIRGVVRTNTLVTLTSHFEGRAIEAIK